MLLNSTASAGMYAVPNQKKSLSLAIRPSLAVAMERGVSSEKSNERISTKKSLRRFFK